jgi:formylglycine-generating enzyme required for sulfatase activity
MQGGYMKIKALTSGLARWAEGIWNNTATLKREAKASATKPVNEKYVLTLALGVSIEMVCIPAGDFLMGSADSDKDAHSDEKPQHQVMLDEYLIGKYPVTNAQFESFVKATSRTWTMLSDKENHPVVNVSWDDAVAFCVWVSQVTGRNVKLPNAAQWEKAARGTDGRLFPWGNREPDASKLNYNSNENSTTPVGKYSPAGDSPYGVADMAGNVWQWTSSLYEPYPYNPNDGREDQTSRGARVLRGGGSYDDHRYVRSSHRCRSVLPGIRNVGIGFRVAALPI